MENRVNCTRNDHLFTSQDVRWNATDYITKKKWMLKNNGFDDIFYAYDPIDKPWIDTYEEGKNDMTYWNNRAYNLYTR